MGQSFDFDAGERDIDECIVEILKSAEPHAENIEFIHMRVVEMANGNVPFGLLQDRMIELRGTGVIIVETQAKKSKKRNKLSTYRLRTDADNERVRWNRAQ